MPTKIEWTDETWNPITGCTKIGPGCKNCYAERMARRLAGRFGYPEAPHHFDATLRHDRLEQPLRWKKPHRVFVCSMSDWLHPDVPFSYAALMFTVMSQTHQHIYQLLTKRAERLLPFFHWAVGGDGTPLFEWPLPNVWLGVSVENQAIADERIPLLLQTPAAVRFVSCEPLLGPIDLLDYDRADALGEWRCDSCGGDGFVQEDEYECDWVNFGPNLIPCPDCEIMRRDRTRAAIGIDWVIVGGESGPGARPMHPQWARDIRDQCQVAGVPFFFKGWGAWLPYGYSWRRVGKKAAGRLLDGVLWEEYPSR